MALPITGPDIVGWGSFQKALSGLSLFPLSLNDYLEYQPHTHVACLNGFLTPRIPYFP